MRSDRALRRRQGGFTLIEVLVAFTIFALSFAAILQIFSGGLHNGATADRALIALGHAESLMARAGVEEPLTPGQTSGQIDEGMTWQQSVSLYRDAAMTAEPPPPGMTPYAVTVSVTWQDRGRTRDVTLNSLRLGDAP
ncbi:prepilin-type N-terminal cleavage/methylation domain-containing protein [Pelagibius sp.]|uniref:type IV pilus modification PilV family protein n=1 Tax=Pelagibius sp. TaxID=1931238 RepID=UPI0026323CD0|nr:prepilin-type N-terminal cleavage/methylation domain-containing protein [Pelagibius sp.]